MSCIRRLLIQNFRNLEYVDISPNNHINLIFGENGSGKTSILESIYFLSTAKSFKTSDSASMIRKNCTELTTFSEVKCQNLSQQVGIRKPVRGKKQIRINDTNSGKLKDLAQVIPSQIITINSYKLFTEGPNARRSFIDKGLFHVDPSYQSLWSKFQSALKQRNAALKTKCSRENIQSWDSSLCQFAEALNAKRRSYIKEITPIINKLSTELLPDHPIIRINFKQGWDESAKLHEQLVNNLERDLILGHTTVGPHKADIQVCIENSTLIKDHLSQGQLKLTAYAMHLAQCDHLSMGHQKNYAVLIDDLTAELDESSVQRVVSLLTKRPGQHFITIINPNNITPLLKKLSVPYQMFHMEHGKCMPVDKTVSNP